MSEQPFLFDRLNPEPCREPDSPYTLHQRALQAEASRLEDAKSRILARLRQGPATNTELNGIAFRYGARIWELNRAGHHIEKEHVEHGVWVYRLVVSS